ncbi:MAG: hypothetical protein JRI40_08485 [Deltaproteobacteria bacterium]|nr:hypothetical protein [Deltaproteobacteria bacterium]
MRRQASKQASKLPHVLADDLRRLDKRQNLKMTKKSQKRLFIITLLFASGSILLSIFSIFQKVLIGADTSVLKGYLVPFLFGGVSGAILGTYIIKVRELNAKLQQRVNTLESFLPICSNCKKIRKPNSDPQKMESWQQLESYISEKTSSQFSHSICPECAEKIYGEIIDDK